MKRFLSLLGAAAGALYVSGCSIEALDPCMGDSSHCSEVVIVYSSSDSTSSDKVKSSSSAKSSSSRHVVIIEEDDDEIIIRRSSSSAAAPVSSASRSSSSSAPSSVTCLPKSIWCANGGYKLEQQPGFDYSNADIWGYYTDVGDGGESFLEWPKSEAPGFLNRVVELCDGMCLTYTLDQGLMIYSPYVGAEVAVAGAAMSGSDFPLDVRSWNGLCVDYKSDASVDMELGLGSIMDKRLEYDLPYVRLPASKGQAVCFTWDRFRQNGWGAVKMPGKDAAAALVKVKFKIQGKSGSHGGFLVRSIAKNLDSENYGGTSSSVVTTPSVTTPSNPVVGTMSGGSYFSWYGNDAIYQIDTGLDNGSETSGYWYTYDDAMDGGKSEIVWPVQMGNEYSEYAMDPIIEECGGICGTYVLNKGTMVYNPMVGVAFNVAGEDDSGRPDAADASKWGGICIAYTSDAPAVLELVPTDKVEKMLSMDDPFVSLPKSSSAVQKCYAWSNFKQAGWGAGKITATELAAQLASIRFKIQGANGSTGNFNVLYVGSLK